MGSKFLGVVGVAVAVSAVGCNVRVDGHGNGDNGKFSIHINGSFDTKKATETVQKSFKAEKVVKLRVNADAGDIKVEPAAEGVDEVQITATKNISGGDHSLSALKSYLPKLEVTAVLQGDTLVVESHHPENDFPHDLSAYVDYAIKVPKRLALELHSASGNVEATGVQGGADVETASGDVKLQTLEGAVHATTASGNIQAHQINAASEFHLESASGDIEATEIKAKESTLKVGLNSQSGSVQFKGTASELDAQTASGEIETTIEKSLALTAANVHSASGSVKLHFPSNLSAKFTAHSASGDINAQGLTTVSPKKEDEGDTHNLEGTVGSGTAPVTIETASGDIEIKVGD